MDHSHNQFAWWYYFWLLVALTAISPFFGPIDLEYWAFLGFDSVGLVGLWAYLRRRPMLSMHLWRVYFAVILFALIYSGIRLFTNEHSDPFGDGSWYKWLVGIWLLSSALLTPLFLALWRYAFHSPDIWRTNPGAA